MKITLTQRVGLLEKSLRFQRIMTMIWMIVVVAIIFFNSQIVENSLKSDKAIYTNQAEMANGLNILSRNQEKLIGGFDVLSRNQEKLIQAVQMLYLVASGVAEIDTNCSIREDIEEIEAEQGQKTGLSLASQI